MKKSHNNRISPFQELWVNIGESWSILLGETRNLIISLLFPFGAAIITVWIAGKDMFNNYESTNSACFIIVCAAIWGGLFNSIQVIVKERNMIKREYISGAMRIGCYTGSRAIIQLGLCAIQSAALCLSFYGIKLVYGNPLPESGLIFSSAIVEYYITTFLIMYAADTLGLMISCFVKSEQLASQMSPYILIVQLLFSGVLFAMEGGATFISALMLSRWGMEALGSTSNLNSLPLRLQSEFPMIPHEVDDAFIYTSGHLRNVWLILMVFVAVPLIIGNIALHGVKKDTRS